MELQEWIKQHRLRATIKEIKDHYYEVVDEDGEQVKETIDLRIVEMEGIGRFLVREHEKEMFDKEFKLTLLACEHIAFIKEDCQYLLFSFGGKWYYSGLDEEVKETANAYYEKHGGGDQKQKVTISSAENTDLGAVAVNLHPFKYLGRAITDFEDDPFVHLGVHGGYELLNGSRLYGDWCDKAKFYGIGQLGLVEKNTLAGTLAFQMACQENEIHPIFGETIDIQLPGEDVVIEGKVYALSKVGWRHLLHINAEINVHSEKQTITWDRLLELGEGVVFVWSSHSSARLTKKLARDLQKAFDAAYYQFDTVSFQSNDTDKTFLLQQDQLIRDGFLEPILINDSYYLDKEDAEIKKILNKIDKGRALKQSDDQYFKDIDETVASCEYLFSDDDDLYHLLGQAMDNACLLAEKADVLIEVGTFKLPKYEMLPEEAEKFSNNEELFHHLLEEGLNEWIPKKDHKICRERLAEEIEVIEEGGFIDYFLILYDIIRFCKKEGILTGIGRGSAGGSLVSYLLGIIKMNPLDYDLLFSRFLNKGRIKVSMPDIDTDFESSRRDEVKRYMEHRYGEDCVCSIGTYGTLKLRAAIQDLGRLNGIESSVRNYMTKILEGGGEHWISLFQCAEETPDLKKFIQSNAQMINTIPLCIGQPKNASVHAAGVIIVPKEDSEGNPMNVYDWMPVKKMDGVLVSEWEGPQCEIAGFLKEDILGIKQLDKFKQIFDLIEQNTGEKLTMEDGDIPLDDPEVYELFHEGFNGDLFHFGSTGLTGYSQDVKPNNIEDLIAMIALYRPGAMLSHAHTDFVQIRNGVMEPEYDFQLESVTKDTQGLYIYQEQVMKACQVIGDFTEVEADDIRRAMGKKKLKVLMPYKERFIAKAIEKGCPDYEAETIWEKLEQFAGYGFNKSHAAAYSITGYKGQWLKYHYPMEYWSVALSNASKEELSKYISEIKKLDQGIEIAPPDINKSGLSFTPDFDEHKVYWALRIKQVGPATLSAIVEERQANGQFFSLEDFMDRVPRNKCKKGQILNLILAGAFDEIMRIDDVRNRRQLLKQYQDLIGEDIDEVYFSRASAQEHFWLIRQKELTGFGHLDYKALIDKSNAFGSTPYVDPLKFFTEDTTKKKSVVIGGLLKTFVERKTKKGDFFANLTLESNDEEMVVTMWKESWEEHRDEIQDHKGGILLLNGQVSFNDFHKKNTMQTQKNTNVVFI